MIGEPKSMPALGATKVGLVAALEYGVQYRLSEAGMAVDGLLGATEPVSELDWPPEAGEYSQEQMDSARTLGEIGILHWSYCQPS